MTDATDDNRKDVMYKAYCQNPDLLGLELEILFEACTDPNFAVLHNRAIDMINILCGETVENRDDLGIEISSGYQLKCKGKLAGHLARSVLMYARQK
jgi:hypothetical protein